MRVFRVQNKHKVGPFSNLKAYDLLTINGTSSFGPAPQHDGGFSDNDIKAFEAGELVCAFLSINQLQKWISEEDLKKLAKIGFLVDEFYVPEVIEGHFQVLISKKYL